MYYMFFLLLEGNHNWNICYYSDGIESCRQICILYFNFLYLSGWDSANYSKFGGFVAVA